MEVVKMLFLICILLVYPLVPGSLMFGILKKKKEEYSPGSVYIAGVLLCGVFFGLLAFLGVRKGLSLDFFAKAALVSALLLLVFCGMLSAVLRSCREGIVFLFTQLKKKPEKEEWIIGLAFLLVAGVYLLRPFSLEPEHDAAERVVTCVETGCLTGSSVLTGDMAPVQGNWRQQLENLPLLYACLCRLTGLSATEVLFGVMPYVVLVYAFCVMALLADLVFQKNKNSRAVVLLLFAMITVCGNTAYMNPSYGLLHYPYEAMTIFSCILLPLAFAYIQSREHVLMLILLCANAVFTAGVEKAVVMLATLLICYGVASFISRFAERRGR